MHLGRLETEENKWRLSLLKVVELVPLRSQLSLRPIAPNICYFVLWFIFVFCFFFLRKPDLTITIACPQPGVYQISLRNRGNSSYLTKTTILTWFVIELKLVGRCLLDYMCVVHCFVSSLLVPGRRLHSSESAIILRLFLSPTKPTTGPSLSPSQRISASKLNWVIHWLVEYLLWGDVSTLFINGGCFIFVLLSASP